MTFVLITFSFLYPWTLLQDIESPSESVDEVPDAVQCRLVLNLRQPARAPYDLDTYYGFSDTGTELLVRPPEEGDIIIGETLLEGLDGNPGVGARDENEETSCRSETPIMIPEGTLQKHLKLKVSREDGYRDFTRGSWKLTLPISMARWTFLV